MAADQDTTLGQEPWHRVWDLFEQVADMSPDQQAEFLDRACAGEPSLRQAVEDMIEADRTEQGVFLDRPVIQNSEASGSTPTPSPQSRSIPKGVPKSVGPYTLLHKVGEGGMSSVFLAVRNDDTYQRQVVVKIVRPGMESEHVVQRLRVERQILASLDHPNVARLFDGGSTEKGLPYFVMEYVDGVPIDTYCRRSELSVESRLRVFLKVCAAVGYAHNNLVVHRDIKPSNILVNAAGEPKLLDFGIAKLLNPDLGSPEIAPTITATRMLTPSYASPEQILGRLVTASSDVYSLGVLLYKLLTHTLPYDFTQRTAIEIEQMITGTEPPRPSQVARGEGGTGKGDYGDPVRLRRRLVGDLDAIVLKALRSAPPQRYGSVAEMAADIERYLQGLPVLARKGSRRYRVAKFISRNRAAISVVALVTALVTNFSFALARQNEQLRQERDQARIERDHKQDVVDLFAGIMRFARPMAKPGQDLSVKEAVLQSAPVMAKRLADQPEVRAQLLIVTGRILHALGYPRQAQEQLDEALQIRGQSFGTDSREVAVVKVSLSESLAFLGQEEEAEKIARQAAEAFRLESERAAETSDSYRADSAYVWALNNLVMLLCQRGDYEAAKEPAHLALEISRNLGSDRIWDRMMALNLMASIQSDSGNYESAVSLQRQGLALSRQIDGEKHPSQINMVSSIARALRWMEEYGAAERHYREALDMVAQFYGPEHPRNAAILNNLASLQFARGEYQSALETFKRGRQVVSRRMGQDHWRNFYFSVNIEASRIRSGDPEQAVRRLRSDLGIWRPKLGEEHWLVHLARGVLGEALFHQGEIAEADRLLTQSYLKLIELDADQRLRQKAFERLSQFLDHQGRAGEIAAFEQRLEGDSPL